MKKIILLLFLFTVSFLPAQDTLIILQYNLLNYGNNTSYCTSSNNNINDKDNYLKTIINYIRPDIFSVNEISDAPSIHLHLLDQVLNTNGINYYKKSTSINQAGSSIVNMLYYNSEKLTLQSHLVAQDYIRDIDVYKMYYNSTNLPAGDTAFIISVVAHLKASSGTTNENKRKVMAQNTMNFLNGYDDNNNYLLSGDFNIYTDQEPAFQQFVNYSNPTLRFYDPLNQMGSWNNNYQYRYVHTQSTHENSNNCAAGGGMDDRFDYILISDNIRKGSKKVKFLPGSYSAVGQDGQHFNKSINASPTNTSVPSNVLNALYHNSDHLPVTLKLVVGENTGINPIPAEFNLSLVNPVKDELQLNISSAQRTSIDIQIIDLTGKLQFAEKLTVSGNQSKHSLPVHQLKPGFYIIRILNGNQVLISKKVVKL